MPLMPTLEALAEVDARPALESRELKMMLFQIDPLQDPRWKAFVECHPESSVFHRVEWLQALKSCYGYIPVVLTTSTPGIPLDNGLALCRIRSSLTGSRLVSLPFSDHCQPLVTARASFDHFIGGMTKDVAENRWKYFEIRPITYTPSAEAGLSVSNTYHFHRLDLRPSEQQLFKRFSKDSVQRKIRRAERESLRYEEGASEKLLECFYRLMILTRRRHGLPPQPLKWFNCLIDAFGERLKIRVAFKDGTAAASILTVDHKRTMVYKYGGSDTRYSSLGGNVLVFWRAIQDAKSKGMEELDMGRSDLGNQGLVNFKENWGATGSMLKYWRYPAQKSKPGPENMIKHVRRLIAIAPDACLIGLSNLLYRHIG